MLVVTILMMATPILILVMMMMIMVVNTIVRSYHGLTGDRVGSDVV